MDALLMNLTGSKIDGESLITGYEKNIEVLSYSHGVAQQITGDQSNTKRTSGKPNHQDFTFTKYMDLSTPVLIDFCNQAKNIPSAIFTVGQNEAGKIDPIIVITFTNVLISSYSVGGGGGGKSQETITFNYTAIEWDYKAQKSDVSEAGTSKAIWNLATNTPALSK